MSRSRLSRSPPTWLRLAIALAAAGVAVAWLGSMELAQPHLVTDFDLAYLGARGLLHGASPFSAGNRVITYPMPAILFAAPLAMMPIEAARLVFVAIASGVLGWGLSRRPDARLFVFASGAWFMAIEDAQWSPLVLAVGTMPALAWVLSTKPNIGLAVAAGADYGDVIKIAALGLILPALSFVVAPGWVGAWRHATAQYDVFLPLVTRPFGALMLLAVVRWRRPEARILLALSLVPLNPALYEAVLVFCVPRRAVEGAGLAVLSWFVEIVAHPVPASYATWSTTNAAAFARGTLICAYLPALLLVLIRPNEGSVPTWLERRLARWPRWLRGAPPPLFTQA